MKTEPGLKCAIYARVSSELQDTKNSIEGQIQSCRTLAQRNEWHILDNHIYIDEARSGSSAYARPEFQRLFDVLRDPSPPPFSVLLVDDDSRLDRGGQLVNIVEAFESRGVAVMCADTGIALTHESQKLLCHVKAGMNQEYLRDLARKTRRGQRAKFLAGFHAGGRIYGYDLVPEWPAGLPTDQRSADNRLGTRVEINEEQATIVRRIFQDYADGCSQRDIARRLNREHIPSPRGGTWDHTAVRSMLLNPKYIGTWTWNTHRWTKKPEILLTEAECMKVRATGHIPRLRIRNEDALQVNEQREELRIVPDELWSAVQKRFEQNKATYHAPGAPPNRHLLSGLLGCSCGGNIVVVRSYRSENRPSWLGCTRHRNRGETVCRNDGVVPEHELGDAVLGTVREKLLTPRAIELAVEETNRQIVEQAHAESSGTDVAKLRAELAALDKRINHYVRAIGEGVDVAEIRDELSRCRAGRDEITRQLARQAEPSAPRTLPRWTRQDVVHELDHLWDDLNSDDVPKSRWLLQQLLGKGSLELVGNSPVKAWKIRFKADPSPILLRLISVNCGGSGGGI